MEEEINLQLNLSTETSRNRPQNPKENRQERLKRKREERRQSQIVFEQQLKSSLKGSTKKHSSPASNKNDSKPTKEDKISVTHKKSQYSSLFKSNPVIPQVNSADVDQLTEKVFSDQTFGDCHLHPHMVSNLSQRFGFKQATSVQKAAIPAILKESDVLVKSQTGSGKTLAYAIPVVQKLQGFSPRVHRNHGVYALVIVPTRELALQSYETLQKLVSSFNWIVPGYLMGGEKKKTEKARLRKGLNIVVGTPGRLLDHLQHTKSLQTSKLQWLVIDEADRLLDMGFEKDVSQIIAALDENCVQKRQTILLSATLSPGVERLAGMSLNNPVRIDISEDKLPHGEQHLMAKSSPREHFAVPESLQHHFVVVPSKLRLTTLTAFILWKCKLSQKRSKMIIFLSTQDAVEFHERLLSSTMKNCHLGEEGEEEESSVDVYKLHGDMLQKDRTKIFNEFSQASCGVLLCTDVAARGLDLPQVRWIVQYNTPGTATDYIHRVGRTARAGSHGRALLFLAPSEVDYIKVLNKCSISLHELKMEDILQTLLVEAKTGNWLRMSMGGTPHTIHESATCLQIKFENQIQEDKNLRTLARKAYQSFIRAYATYPSDLKHIFHVKHLHLGHIAKSFGLQDAPTRIGEMTGKFAKMDRKSTGKKRKLENAHDSNPKAAKMSKTKAKAVSEFASGLEGIPKSKQKKKGPKGKSWK